MSTEQDNINRLWDGAQPFKIVPESNFIPHVYQGTLEALKLTPECTAEDVRRVAISLRAQAKNKGIDIETLKALKSVLYTTHDCLNPQEFDQFLLYNATFDDIAAGRIR